MCNTISKSNKPQTKSPINFLRASRFAPKRKANKYEVILKFNVKSLFCSEREISLVRKARRGPRKEIIF